MDNQTTKKYSKKKFIQANFSRSFKCFVLTIWEEICEMPPCKISFVAGFFKGIILAFKDKSSKEIKHQLKLGDLKKGQEIKEEVWKEVANQEI